MIKKEELDKASVRIDTFNQMKVLCDLFGYIPVLMHSNSYRSELFWYELGKRVLMELEQYYVNSDMCKELLMEKHKCYGSDPIMATGIEGIRIRCIDKLFRMKHMIDNDRESKSEPIKDTCIDLYNYSILSLLYLRGQIY